jgi:hypothetical protein
MAVRPRKGGSGTEQHRALEMLAESPHGCTESIILVNSGQDRYRMRRRVSRLPGLTVDGLGLSAVLSKQSN